MLNNAGGIEAQEHPFHGPFQSTQGLLLAEIDDLGVPFHLRDRAAMATFRRSQIDPHRYVGLHQKTGRDAAVGVLR